MMEKQMTGMELTMYVSISEGEKVLYYWEELAVKGSLACQDIFA